MKRSTSRLARQIASCKVPAKSIALARLGQAGFLLKSPGGTLIALDPYLSNSCEALARPLGVNMRRMTPAPLHPHELLACDLLCFTHSHDDHVDAETVRPYLNAGGEGPYLAPHDAREKLVKLGAKREAIELTWPGHKTQVGDITLTATFAIPFGADDLTHVGYLAEIRNGPTVYFTGDTDYNDILHLGVAAAKPDILVSVINGAYRNLTPRDAAQLARELRPRWVIPCHHDLFPDNGVPARLLRTNLVTLGLEESFCPLADGEIRILAGASRRKRKS